MGATRRSAACDAERDAPREPEGRSTRDILPPVNSLRELPGVSLVVPGFRLTANLEAFSWAGLLLGMLFKYGIDSQAHLGETLVTIFGSIHGALVIIYLALAGLSWLTLRWKFSTLALAIGCTIPPFATVAFDRWAERKGLYQPR